MSGIYGYCVSGRVTDIDHVLPKMRDAIPSYDETVDALWVDPTNACVGLGARHPSRTRPPRAFAEDAASGVRCVFDGVIYPNNAGVDECLIEMHAASYLLARFLDMGPACVEQLNGSFNVAWWDERSMRLIVANDRIGHRLLFIGTDNSTLVFASYLARVMDSGLIDPAIDIEGLADLLNFGYILGTRTLFDRVRTLPPASFLTFEYGKTHVERYWSADEIEPYGAYNAQRLDEVQSVFQAAIRRGFRTDVDTALDLTGGLDSRTLLAGAASLDLPYITHTGGQPDSTDVVLAQKVSEVAGAEHYFEPIGPDSVNEWLFPMALHLGGMVATLHGHPCQHFERPMPFDVAIQGTGTSFIRGFWNVTETNYLKDDTQYVQKHVENALTSSIGKRMAIEDLWQDRYRDVAFHVKQERIAEMLRQFRPGLSVVDAVTYLHLTEQCRKFLNKAIMILRNVREVYFPLFDHELLLTLAAIPPSVRIGNRGRRIELDLIRRLYPKLLDVPYESTLMPPSASAAQEWRTKKLRRANRLLTRWLKFPNWTPKKLPAHYFCDWIRRDMVGTLTDLLCKPDAAFRQYLDGGKIDTLISEHFACDTNNEQLIGGLAMFEICHRLWVDRDPDIVRRAYRW